MSTARTEIVVEIRLVGTDHMLRIRCWDPGDMEKLLGQHEIDSVDVKVEEYGKPTETLHRSLRAGQWGFS